jgi:hypothetical protein
MTIARAAPDPTGKCATPADLAAEPDADPPHLNRRGIH